LEQRPNWRIIGYIDLAQQFEPPPFSIIETSTHRWLAIVAMTDHGSGIGSSSMNWFQPVYNLVVNKGGPKLQESAAGAKFTAMTSSIGSYSKHSTERYGLALEWHWVLPLVLHLQEIAKTDFKLGHYRRQPFAR
jgi:hypothetical protein